MNKIQQAFFKKRGVLKIRHVMNKFLELDCAKNNTFVELR